MNECILQLYIKGPRTQMIMHLELRCLDPELTYMILETFWNREWNTKVLAKNWYMKPKLTYEIWAFMVDIQIKERK